MMLAAAEAVAGKLSKAELAQGSILPDVKRIRSACALDTLFHLSAANGDSTNA